MSLTTTYSLNTTKFEFAANTWTPSTQFGADVLGLPNGGFAVAYISENAGADNNWVLLDFYDSSHNVIGSWKIPYSGTVEGAGETSLTLLANGNVLVVWDDNGTGEEGMKGAIYTQAGALVTADIDLADSVIFQEMDVTALSNGNFVVSYTTTVDNIFFRVFDGNGVQQGSLVVVNQSQTGFQGEAQIVSLSGGGFVVTWTDFNPPGDLVMGRVFNDDGSARTNEFIIGNFGNNTQSAIAALDNGNWAVVYRDDGWGTPGLTLHIYDANGNDLTSFIRVDSNLAAAESDPDITVLDNGLIVVTWTHPFSAADDDIYGALFDQSGNRLTVDGSSFFVLTATGDRDIKSAVSALLDGKFVTVWQDGASGDIIGEVNELVRNTVGDAANDSFTGDNLRDSVFGGDGNDTLNGGDNQDTIDGGSGSDDLGGGSGNDTLNGGDGDDVIDGNSDDDVIAGGAGNDSIDGNFGSDTISGGDGNDTINADLGFFTDDTLFNSLSGDAGNDSISGSDGGESIDGGSGFDTLNGGDGNDTMFGGSFDDTINGGNGDDLIQGGFSVDSINGGAGNDTILVLEGEFSDNIDGGAGLDTLNLSNILADGFDADAANINLAAGTWTLSPAFPGAQSIAGIETVIATVGNDTVTGAAIGETVLALAGADRVAGGLGNDTLNGGMDNDTLSGQNGDDRLLGGLGNDSLVGGANRDTMTGNDGADRFDFNLVSESGITAATRDIITDFNAGTNVTSVDRIDVFTIDANTGLAGNQAFIYGGPFVAGHIQAIQSGANVLLRFNTDADAAAEMTIQLNNVNAVNLNAGDFVL
jgi:Ca2+-binding RTX toxin-like protein